MSTPRSVWWPKQRCRSGGAHSTEGVRGPRGRRSTEGPLPEKREPRREMNRTTSDRGALCLRVHKKHCSHAIRVAVGGTRVPSTGVGRMRGVR